MRVIGRCVHGNVISNIQCLPNKSCSVSFILIAGNQVGKKMLIFTFECKIEYIILHMLILFLDMWHNTYGWMSSL